MSKLDQKLQPVRAGVQSPTPPIAQIAKPTYGALPATGYVREAKLIGEEILPFSRAQLWKMVKAGKFPAPVKFSPQVTAWKVELVREWLDARGVQQ
ncbi:AlpA family phage regulatory protein [Chitinibacter sp. FCG-7]|uniref:AlpA family phage regulatory protein n=1 Tax=Chitinibacter mangrovi TaxID=3153927 RepID=A0AAU7F6P5_9NEIS